MCGRTGEQFEAEEESTADAADDEAQRVAKGPARPGNQRPEEYGANLDRIDETEALNAQPPPSRTGVHRCQRHAEQ